TQMFGTVMENVVYDPLTRVADLDDGSKTENTRAAYPLTSIPNIMPEGYAGHPSNIIMLTADAFGVLPPVARLTPEQAMYHFLSGYTAKVAGTERGVTEPTATFSTCFGAPFMILHPGVYADLLGRKIQQSGAACWLINTGWSGGPYGEGSRMKIRYTRAMIRAILNGTLSKVETHADPVFGVGVPASCPDVPPEVLVPRNTWADKAAYDAKARDLANRFNENFKKYADGVSPEVRAAAPRARQSPLVPSVPVKHGGRAQNFQLPVNPNQLEAELERRERLRLGGNQSRPRRAAQILPVRHPSPRRVDVVMLDRVVVRPLGLNAEDGLRRGHVRAQRGGRFFQRRSHAAQLCDGFDGRAAVFLRHRVAVAVRGVARFGVRAFVVPLVGRDADLRAVGFEQFDHPAREFVGEIKLIPVVAHAGRFALVVAEGHVDDDRAR
ncbi:MAG: phosphoenolpyruvate carboxykinase (ATP), partial [Acidobacteria bacterium]|nr:phosphoenolpyruvate carboxykinase (ATP) [Acidobacteriota bacterium]